MVEVRRIHSNDDASLENLIQIYENSFPECERRDRDALNSLIQKEESMRLCEILHDGHGIGMTVFWDFDSFIYVEHLALHESHRCKGFGSVVLSHIKGYSKPVVIEVEPPESHLSKRRINYYLRNGFKIVNTSYIQPPYRHGGSSVPLWIMVWTSDENVALPDDYLDNIKQKIYLHESKQ